MSPEKGGGLRTQSTGGRRVLVASLLSGGLLLVPLLLLGTGAPSTSGAAAVAGGGRATADTSARPRVGVIPHLQLTHFAASTTTTTAPQQTTTTAPPTTTTTVAAHPTTTTTTTRPQAANTATGGATWYAESPDGMCASPWLPFGTTVTVTNEATGASITCVVDDREADNPGRVVDLSPDGFSALAPLSQGVIEVTISW
jgi:rare lipoprotein A